MEQGVDYIKISLWHNMDLSSLFEIADTLNRVHFDSVRVVVDDEKIGLNFYDYGRVIPHPYTINPSLRLKTALSCMQLRGKLAKSKFMRELVKTYNQLPKIDTHDELDETTEDKLSPGRTNECIGQCISPGVSQVQDKISQGGSCLLNEL